MSLARGGRPPPALCLLGPSGQARAQTMVVWALAAAWASPLTGSGRAVRFAVWKVKGWLVCRMLHLPGACKDLVMTIPSYSNEETGWRSRWGN